VCYSYRARLQLEAEEDDSILRNKQRMLNVCATRYQGCVVYFTCLNEFFVFLIRIQRAWKGYAARKSTNFIHKGDSFEEEVFRATGLKVDEVIGGHITSTVSDQSNVRVDSFENPSSLLDSSSDDEECHSETEDSHLVNVDSVETQQEVEDIETKNETNLATQKNDKRVRFILPTYSDSTGAEHSANDDSVNSDETFTTEENIAVVDNGDFIMSSSSIPDKVPVEQIHQMGYTQLRELKCTLETKLGSK